MDETKLARDIRQMARRQGVTPQLLIKTFPHVMEKPITTSDERPQPSPSRTPPRTRERAEGASAV